MLVTQRAAAGLHSVSGRKHAPTRAAPRRVAAAAAVEQLVPPPIDLEEDAMHCGVEGASCRRHSRLSRNLLAAVLLALAFTSCFPPRPPAPNVVQVRSCRAPRL